MKEIKFEDFLIYSDATIKDALKKLDLATSKVLFVKDKSEAFLGALSDGDIRRCILNNVSLDVSVNDICNKKSLALKLGFDKSGACYEMNERNILFAPVLDEKSHIVDIFTLPESHKEIVHSDQPALNLPVVIMAGGKGTRLKPFTDVFPKPLVPVNEKPIMDWIIEGFCKYGINQFYGTLNYRGKMIEAYYESIEKNYSIDFVWEKDFYGTAGSLFLLKDKIKDTFIVSNCDIIVKADYRDVVNFHKKNDSILTVVSSMQHVKVPYGVMEFEKGGIVSAVKEKPEYTFPINTGVYILERECLDYIPENTFFHITHLMEKLVESDCKVMTYPVNENDYIDIGQWEEYRNNLEKI